MDPITIIAVLTQVVSLANLALKAGQDVAPFVAAIKSAFGGEGAVTQDQIDALYAQVMKLADDFDLPLPPDDGTVAT